MIAHARQIFAAAATNHTDGMLLQIMADTRNISGDFHAVRQTDAGNFPQSRVWLFWGGGGDFDTDPALKRRAFRQLVRAPLKQVKPAVQGRGFGFVNLLDSSVTD